MSMDTEGWRQNKKAFFFISAPPILWLTIFFVIPLVTIFLLSFSEKEGIVDHNLVWTLDNYARAFEADYLRTFVKSLIIAASATVLCLLVAYPIALAIAFSPQRLKIPLLMAVTIPFWINILIRTYSLQAVFRTRGVINYVLEWFWTLGVVPMEAVGITVGDYPALELLYSNVAVTLGIVYVFLPFMILPLYAVLERFDKSYLEASLDLGGGHWRAFWHVMLPLTLPGILSGIIIVFVPALGAFFIADMLGGVESQLIGNIIERQFLAANNLPFGSALSFILMYLTFVIIMLRAMFNSRAKKQGRLDA